MRTIIRLTIVLQLFTAAGVMACEPVKKGETPAVKNVIEAIARAKAAWMSKNSKFTAEYIAKFKPYHAVRQGNVWHVSGQLLNNVGSSPEAYVCRSDGNTVVPQR
jgi:hypothetical protein